MNEPSNAFRVNAESRTSYGVMDYVPVEKDSRALWFKVSLTFEQEPVLTPDELQQLGPAFGELLKAVRGIIACRSAQVSK